MALGKYPCPGAQARQQVLARMALEPEIFGALQGDQHMTSQASEEARQPSGICFQHSHRIGRITGFEAEPDRPGASMSPNVVIAGNFLLIANSLANSRAHGHSPAAVMGQTKKRRARMKNTENAAIEVVIS